jgi:hypothetical protein
MRVPQRQSIPFPDTSGMAGVAGAVKDAAAKRSRPFRPRSLTALVTSKLARWGRERNGRVL